MQKLYLVVDDEEAIRNVIIELIGEFDDYKAVGAESGLKALELMRSINFNLILLDLEMPGMSGNQFLEELTTTAPAIPVIVVSANPAKLKPHPQVKSIIAKPFDIEQLLAFLEKHTT